MSNYVTYNDGDKVIFDNVTSNVGNGYDNVTGIFTVPHNGSYELTLRNMGSPGQIFTQIVQNDARLCVAHGTGINDQGKYIHIFTYWYELESIERSLISLLLALW